MIVSPAISQRNYIIGNDSIVGYTKKENRTIAVIFQDRALLKDISTINDSIINVYKLNQIKLEDNIFIYAAKEEVTAIENMKLNYKLADEIKSKNKWKLIGQGGIVSTAILIVITILK